MRFKLTAPHAMFEQVLPAGTEIGTGTPWDYQGAPSMNMEPLDDEARHAIDARAHRKAPLSELTMSTDKPKAEPATLGSKVNEPDPNKVRNPMGDMAPTRPVPSPQPAPGPHGVNVVKPGETKK